MKYKLDIRLLSGNYAFILNRVKTRRSTKMRCFKNKTFQRFRQQAVLQVKAIFYSTLHFSCRLAVVPYAWLKLPFKTFKITELLSDQNTIKMKRKVR
jgi:hypothetical protein